MHNAIILEPWCGLLRAEIDSDKRPHANIASNAWMQTFEAHVRAGQYSGRVPQDLDIIVARTKERILGESFPGEHKIEAIRALDEAYERVKRRLARRWQS